MQWKQTLFFKNLEMRPLLAQVDLLRDEYRYSVYVRLPEIAAMGLDILDTVMREGGKGEAFDSVLIMMKRRSEWIEEKRRRKKALWRRIGESTEYRGHTHTPCTTSLSHA